MTDFNFNFETVPPVTPEKLNGIHQPDENNIISETTSDPNSIIVQVTDNIPLIILWGPASSGKSVAMIRLARYLKKQHYQVSPVKNFRIKDKVYEELCRDFNGFLSNHFAPKGTGAVNFMLLQLEKDGKKICQVLEAPGEHYFDSKHPEAPLPTYLSTIVNSNSDKIYIFFLEKSWPNEADRQAYSNKISTFMGNVQSKDSVILLCNKSDTEGGYTYNGKPETKRYFKDIQRLYPQIFDRLGKRNLLFKIFATESRRYDFVAFSSGEFKDSDAGGQVFVEGRDVYPESLWSAIMKNVKGSWF